MKDEAPPDLRERTKAFGVRIMHLCDSLPSRRSVRVITNQLLRCGTAPGAHYREGKRSRSHAEVISKLESALQELDESTYWLELLVDGGIVNANQLEPLRREANELIAILVACVKNVKRRTR